MLDTALGAIPLPEGSSPRSDAKPAFAEEQAEKADLKIVSDGLAAPAIRIVECNETEESVSDQLELRGTKSGAGTTESDAGLLDADVNSETSDSCDGQRVNEFSGESAPLSASEASSGKEHTAGGDDHFHPNLEVAGGSHSAVSGSLRKAFSNFLAGLAKLLLFSIGSILAIIVVVMVWGHQILGAIDKELSKNPYTSIPVAKLAEPLFGEDRVAYGKVLCGQILSMINHDRNGRSGGVPWDPYYDDLVQKLEKLNLSKNPLYAYVFVEYARQKSAFHAGDLRKVENDLLKAVDCASALVGPQNRLTAAANRQAAVGFLNRLQPSSDNLKDRKAYSSCHKH
jgi:hypothetical protein